MKQENVYLLPTLSAPEMNRTQLVQTKEDQNAFPKPRLGAKSDITAMVDSIFEQRSGLCTYNVKKTCTPHCNSYAMMRYIMERFDKGCNDLQKDGKIGNVDRCKSCACDYLESKKPYWFEPVFGERRGKKWCLKWAKYPGCKWYEPRPWDIFSSTRYKCTKGIRECQA